MSSRNDVMSHLPSFFLPSLLLSSPVSLPSLSSLLSSPLPPLFYSLLFSSILQVQLQAWNAIDTATPIEMIGKTALNLLWFTVLARTLSTIFKQYVQASREFLLQLKEKQLSGNNNQVFSFVSKSYFI